MDIVAGTSARQTATAADSCAASPCASGVRYDAATINGDIAAGATSTSTSTTTADSCASKISCAAVGGDRAAINDDRTAVSAIPRFEGAAANACAAIVAGLTASGCVNHASMNSDCAAVNRCNAAADPRTGVIAAVCRAGSRQCAGAARLGVDSQTVAQQIKVLISRTKTSN